jgi:hypothetical protein
MHQIRARPYPSNGTPKLKALTGIRISADPDGMPTRRSSQLTRRVVPRRVMPALGGFGSVLMLARGRVGPSTEGPVVGLGRPEPARWCDWSDGSVGGVEESACGLEPDRFDVVGRGGTHLCLEDAGEVSFGKLDLPSEGTGSPR